MEAVEISGNVEESQEARFKRLRSMFESPAPEQQQQVPEERLQELAAMRKSITSKRPQGEEKDDGQEVDAEASEPQLPVTSGLHQLEEEKQSICQENKELKDKLETLTKKMEPQRPEDHEELKKEIFELNKLKEAYKDQIMDAEKKLTQQETMKRELMELEATRDQVREENQALQDRLSELALKDQKDQEDLQSSADLLKTETEALKEHTAKLQDEMKSAKAQLSSLKLRRSGLEAQNKLFKEENESLQCKISTLLWKIAKEKSSDSEVIGMRVSKRLLTHENNELKKHKEKLTKEHEKLKLTAAEHKLELKEFDKVKGENFLLQEKLEELTSKVRDLESEKEKHKDLGKKDAEVKAKNKQLMKDIEKLNKKLQKLQPVQKEHEKFSRDLDDLRKETLRLHQKKKAVNEEILTKKLLKITLKSLQAEEKGLLKTNKGLMKEIDRVRRLHQEQQCLLFQEKEGFNFFKRDVQCCNQGLIEELVEHYVDMESSRIQNSLL